MQRAVRTLNRLILTLGFAAALGLTSVSADFTSAKCDPACKYSQSQVYYTDNGSTVTVGERQFQGGVDDGAVYWRMDSIKDKVGGSVQVTHGPGSWASNYSLSSWYHFVGESTPTYGSTVEVHYLWKFEECTPGCYYWYNGDVIPWMHSITP